MTFGIAIFFNKLLFWSTFNLNVLSKYCFFWDQLPLAVTHCHLLSLIVTLYHSLYLSLLLVITRYHSLSLLVICCDSLSFVITCCTTCCNSLSLVVTFVINCCLSLSLVVTQCTTYLSSSVIS